MHYASISIAVRLAFVIGASALGACGISEDQELALGAADAAKVDSELPIVHDSLINQYVSTLGRSMALQTSRADLDWHFAVVNSSDVNAFALPAGFIYVNGLDSLLRPRSDQLRGTSTRFSRSWCGTPT